MKFLQIYKTESIITPQCSVYYSTEKIGLKEIYKMSQKEAKGNCLQKQERLKYLIGIYNDTCSSSSSCCSFGFAITLWTIQHLIRCRERKQNHKRR